MHYINFFKSVLLIKDWAGKKIWTHFNFYDFWVFFSLISLWTYTWWVNSVSCAKVIAINRCLSNDLDALCFSAILYPMMQPNHLYESQMKPWDIKCWLYHLCLLHVCGTAMWYNWHDMQVLVFRKTWQFL